jgi:predicted  nucleic acid-binding Zn-ribbon protein
VQHLNQTIHELRDALRDKENTIQDLKRETDVLSAELDSDSTADFSIIATLRKQLDKYQRKVASLTQQLNGRVSK